MALTYHICDVLKGSHPGWSLFAHQTSLQSDADSDSDAFSFNLFVVLDPGSQSWPVLDYGFPSLRFEIFSKTLEIVHCTHTPQEADLTWEALHRIFQLHQPTWIRTSLILATEVLEIKVFMHIS